MAYDPADINNVGPGWHPIVERMKDLLDESAPGWKALQIKEKFGGLRFYYDLPGGIHDDDARTLRAELQEIESESSTVCEECGEPGSTRSISGWWKTVCQDHYAEYVQARADRS